MLKNYSLNPKDVEIVSLLKGLYQTSHNDAKFQEMKVETALKSWKIIDISIYKNKIPKKFSDLFLPRVSHKPFCLEPWFYLKSYLHRTIKFFIFLIKKFLHLKLNFLLR